MRVTTFYSYKGGLGRSLLTAWCARALAMEGQTVVALDLDLEAPGLSFKLGFKPEDDLGPGVVGLLASFQRGEPPPESLERWLRAVPKSPRVWLLPAGPLASPAYWRELASISWESLFFDPDAQGARFFLWLREAIEREPAPGHLLIDARTGVTEMGGAALSLMADQILALVGTAYEGIHGTREVLRAVVAAPRPPGRPPARIGLVLARMPGSETVSHLHRLRRDVRESIREEADPLTATVQVDLPLVVRSEPRVQWNELAVFSELDLRIHEDYRTVLSWLRGGSVPQELPGIPIPASPSPEALLGSIELERRLAERDPDNYLPELAASLNNLASDLVSRGRWEEALQATQEAVELYRRLAKARPDAFEPDLVTSLGARRSALRDTDPRAAAESFQEGLQILLPHLRRTPSAFAGLATSLARRTIDACQAAGMEPDAELLGEVDVLLEASS